MIALKSIVYPILIFFLLLLANPLAAQQSDAAETYRQEQLETNSKLNREKWKSMSKDFDYSKGKKKKAAKKDDKKEEFRPSKDRSPKVSTAAGEALKYLLFGIIILILAYIVIRLIAGGSIFNNKKLPKDKVYSLDDIEDNLHEVNVEAFLGDALQQQNYRLAIRLYYLSILKGLSLSGKIHWKKDKTNGMYLLEMYNDPNIAEFRKTTYIYEYVWFNEEVPFSTQEFEKVRPIFRNMLTIAEQPKTASLVA